ncbi:MAG: TetR/AcrR family transcriptional regulator [Actinomycetota bacterium]
MAVTETEDVRRRILDVTAELMRDHGVAGVGQRRVAELVGVKAASLYHHFGSKNEIVEAVFRQGIDVMETAWDGAAARSFPTSQARVGAHVRAHLSALFENGPYTAAHLTAFRTAPAEVRRAVVPMRDAYEARWTALLAELGEAGELVAGTPIGLTRLTLLGAMNATLDWFDPERGQLDQLADTITRQIWQGVAARPGSIAPPGPVARPTIGAVEAAAP